MTLHEYIEAIRALAAAEGDLGNEGYWSSSHWQQFLADGLTPDDAWDLEKNPALRAL